MIFLRVLFFFFFLMIRRPTRSTSTNTLFPYNDALPIFVLDWAKQHGIGFSHFISLGDSADVDFGDMLDYLASDPQTRAILLYIESVKHARKFIPAADRKSVVKGKSVSGRVDIGGRRRIKKNINNNKHNS